jgi:hypothetical protein
MRTGNNSCAGQHDFFVADVAQVTLEGKVVVTALCKLCGDLVVHPVQVAATSNSRQG